MRADFVVAGRQCNRQARSLRKGFGRDLARVVHTVTAVYAGSEGSTIGVGVNLAHLRGGHRERVIAQFLRRLGKQGLAIGAHQRRVWEFARPWSPKRIAARLRHPTNIAGLPRYTTGVPNLS